MQPDIYYTQRVATLQQQLAVLQTKKTRIAWLRFINIALLFAAIYFLWPIPWPYISGAAILLVTVFTQLVFADINNNKAIAHCKHLIDINEGELKALAHNYYHFENGSEFIDPTHFYANDLDIFGKASLYQYINRTTSQIGGSTLAKWLLAPTGAALIEQRQTAVKELVTKPEYRQQLQALGKEKKIQTATQTRLQQWFAGSNNFITHKYWLAAQYVIPAIVIVFLLLNIFDVINNYARNYCLLAAAIIAGFIFKIVTPLHQQVSKIADELGVLADSIKAIEQEKFNSPLLQQLQAQFVQKNNSASAQLKELQKILERLDLRYNPVVFIPLDIILQWDLQQAIALEKWKQRNANTVLEWFTALGKIEALNSFATVAFNNPNWCYPKLQQQHFFIEGTAIGHPLINTDKRVNNNITINDCGEVMLITGSNMAGKSTYLRSIGVNVVLAMAGAPVCAAKFSLSPVTIISSMRIADNLEESTSTFYAELKKLKTIIDKVNAGEKIFILLDEILRGTNSFDRHTGSEALIKQMIKHKAACIIATHDIELAKMQQAYPQNILNYHFDVQVSNEELYFDYVLKEGICTSLNASILMKKIGIEL
jgi:DNA mismatch repair ATPase MutS